MKLRKNIQLGKINLLVFFFLIVFANNLFSDEKNLSGNFVELKVLDKEIVLNSIKLKWNLVENEFKNLTKDLKFS